MSSPLRIPFAVAAASAIALFVAAASGGAAPRSPTPITTAFAVPVACADGWGPTWAEASYGEGRIVMRTSLCDAIARAQAGRIQGRVQMGMAAVGVLMLSHELAHALGAVDRSVTAAGENPDEADCVAWRLFPWVAWRLGIAHRLGQRLAALVVNVGRPACMRTGA